MRGIRLDSDVEDTPEKQRSAHDQAPHEQPGARNRSVAINAGDDTQALGRGLAAAQPARKSRLRLASKPSTGSAPCSQSDHVEAPQQPPDGAANTQAGAALTETVAALLPVQQAPAATPQRPRPLISDAAAVPLAAVDADRPVAQNAAAGSVAEVQIQGGGGCGDSVLRTTVAAELGGREGLAEGAAGPASSSLAATAAAAATAIPTEGVPSTGVSVHGGAAERETGHEGVPAQLDAQAEEEAPLPGHNGAKAREDAAGPTARVPQAAGLKASQRPTGNTAATAAPNVAGSGGAAAGGVGGKKSVQSKLSFFAPQVRRQSAKPQPAPAEEAEAAGTTVATAGGTAAAPTAKAPVAAGDRTAEPQAAPLPNIEPGGTVGLAGADTGGQPALQIGGGAGVPASGGEVTDLATSEPGPSAAAAAPVVCRIDLTSHTGEAAAPGGVDKGGCQVATGLGAPLSSPAKQQAGSGTGGAQEQQQQQEPAGTYPRGAAAAPAARSSYPLRARRQALLPGAPPPPPPVPVAADTQPAADAVPAAVTGSPVKKRQRRNGAGAGPGTTGPEGGRGGGGSGTGRARGQGGNRGCRGRNRGSDVAAASAAGAATAAEDQAKNGSDANLAAALPAAASAAAAATQAAALDDGGVISDSDRVSSSSSGGDDDGGLDSPGYKPAAGRRRTSASGASRRGGGGGRGRGRGGRGGGRGNAMAAAAPAVAAAAGKEAAPAAAEQTQGDQTAGAAPGVDKAAGAVGEGGCVPECTATADAPNDGGGAGAIPGGVASGGPGPGKGPSDQLPAAQPQQPQQPQQQVAEPAVVNNVNEMFLSVAERKRRQKQRQQEEAAAKERAVEAERLAAEEQQQREKAERIRAREQQRQRELEQQARDRREGSGEGSGGGAERIDLSESPPKPAPAPVNSFFRARKRVEPPAGCEAGGAAKRPSGGGAAVAFGNASRLPSALAPIHVRQYDAEHETTQDTLPPHLLQLPPLTSAAAVPATLHVRQFDGSFTFSFMRRQPLPDCPRQPLQRGAMDGAATAGRRHDKTKHRGGGGGGREDDDVPPILEELAEYLAAAATQRVGGGGEADPDTAVELLDLPTREDILQQLNDELTLRRQRLAAQSSPSPSAPLPLAGAETGGGAPAPAPAAAAATGGVAVAAAATGPARGGAPSPASPTDPPGQLWSVAQQPTCAAEQCGNAEQVGRLRGWLSQWRDLIHKEGQRGEEGPSAAAAGVARRGGKQRSGRRGRTRSPAFSDDDDFCCSDDDFETTSAGGAADSGASGGPRGGAAEYQGIPTALLLRGPPGCGKTAAAYAVACELGFRVLEVNPGADRGGPQLLRMVGEATKSRRLVHGRGAFGGRGGAATAGGLGEPGGATVAAGAGAGSGAERGRGRGGGGRGGGRGAAGGARRRSGRRIAVSDDSDDSDDSPASSSPSPVKRRRSSRGGGGAAATAAARLFGAKGTAVTAAAAAAAPDSAGTADPSVPSGAAATRGSSGSAATVMLFDEVDVLPEEDKGFVGALVSIIQESKRPVILTAGQGELPPALRSLGLQEVAFQPPGETEMLRTLALAVACASSTAGATTTPAPAVGGAGAGASGAQGGCGAAAAGLSRPPTRQGAKPSAAAAATDDPEVMDLSAGADSEREGDASERSAHRSTSIGTRGPRLPALLRLVRSCRGDLRRALMQTQFWLGLDGGLVGSRCHVRGARAVQEADAAEGEEEDGGMTAGDAPQGGLSGGCGAGCVQALTTAQHAVYGAIAAAAAAASAGGEAAGAAERSEVHHHHASGGGGGDGGSSSSLLLVPPCGGGGNASASLAEQAAALDKWTTRAARRMWMPAGKGTPLASLGSSGGCGVHEGGGSEGNASACDAPAAPPPPPSLPLPQPEVPPPRNPAERTAQWLSYEEGCRTARVQHLAFRWLELEASRAAARVAKRRASRASAGGGHVSSYAPEGTPLSAEDEEGGDAEAEQEEEEARDAGGASEHAGGKEEGDEAGGQEQGGTRGRPAAMEESDGEEGAEGRVSAEDASLSPSMAEDPADSGAEPLGPQQPDRPAQQQRVHQLSTHKRRAEAEPERMAATTGIGGDGPSGPEDAAAGGPGAAIGAASAAKRSRTTADEVLVVAAVGSQGPPDDETSGSAATLGQLPLGHDLHSAEGVTAACGAVPAPPPLPYKPEALAALTAAQRASRRQPQSISGDAAAVPGPYDAAVQDCRTQAALADLYDTLSELELLSLPRDTFAPVWGACPTQHQTACASHRPIGLGVNITLQPPPSYGGISRTTWVLADAVRAAEDLPGRLLSVLAAEAETVGPGSGEPGGPVGQWCAAEAAASVTRLATAAAVPFPTTSTASIIQHGGAQGQSSIPPAPPPVAVLPQPDPWLLTSLHCALVEVANGAATGGAPAVIDRLSSLALICRAETARQQLEGRRAGRVRRAAAFTHYLQGVVPHLEMQRLPAVMRLNLMGPGVVR